MELSEIMAEIDEKKVEGALLIVAAPLLVLGLQSSELIHVGVLGMVLCRLVAPYFNYV